MRIKLLTVRRLRQLGCAFHVLGFLRFAVLDLLHIDVRSASKCKFQRPRCNMGFRCASRRLQPSPSSLDRSVDLAKAQIATFLEGLYKEIMTRSSSWVGFRVQVSRYHRHVGQQGTHKAPRSWLVFSFLAALPLSRVGRSVLNMCSCLGLQHNQG